MAVLNTNKEPYFLYCDRTYGSVKRMAMIGKNKKAVFIAYKYEFITPTPYLNYTIILKTKKE